MAHGVDRSHFGRFT